MGIAHNRQTHRHTRAGDGKKNLVPFHFPPSLATFSSFSSLPSPSPPSLPVIHFVSLVPGVPSPPKSSYAVCALPAWQVGIMHCSCGLESWPMKTTNDLLTYNTSQITELLAASICPVISFDVDIYCQ